MANSNIKKSVVQDWMQNITWKQQTVVLAAMRGCDGVGKDDVSKKVHKLMRACVLENAGTKNTGFMATDLADWHDDQVYTERMNRVYEFRRDIDKYPTHYILHFMHAAEIIGFNHPDEKVRQFWEQAYLVFVNAMHLQPEIKAENDFRLRDGVDSD